MKTAALFLLLVASNAIARDVAEIPNVATLTDEQHQCPYGWREARRVDFTRGCWRVDYPSYTVYIQWRDGKRAVYTEMQFEIHGELKR